MAALMKVVNNLSDMADRRILSLLCLSATFDTVDRPRDAAAMSPRLFDVIAAALVLV